MTGKSFCQDTTYNWTGLAGDNNWGTAGNWDSGIVPDSSSVIALFGSEFSSTPTITVDSSYQIDELSFTSTNNVTLTGSGSLTIGGGSSSSNLSVSGSGTYSIGIPINLASTSAAVNISNGTLTTAVDSVFSSSDLSVTMASGIFNLSVGSQAIGVFSGTSTSSVELSNGNTLTIDNINALPFSTTYYGYITGTGGITLSGGTIFFTPSGSFANDYSGTTFIESGATLLPGNTNGLSLNSSVTVDGSLIIEGFSSTIPSLFGGSASNVQMTGETTFIITGGGDYFGYLTGIGDVQLTGGTLILTPSGSFPNNYEGLTYIAEGAILQAGNTEALSIYSSYSVNGTLLLNGNSNTMGFLFGESTGVVEMTSGETLTVSGGAYFGYITGNGSLNLSSNAELFLNPSGSFPNNYSGETLISNGAVLQVGNENSLSSNSDFTVDGSLLLDGFSNTILSLSGTSTGVVEMTSGETLTIQNGGTTFSGYITGTGGITLNGGILTLTPSGSSSNNYTETTLIESSATLQAGNTGAFSSNSAFTVDGTLLLNGYSNTISSLSGASTGVVEMTSGEILTISDGETTFSGYITGTGGIILSGGTLTLTPSGSSSNNYTGATLIESGATLQAGNTSAFSSNSAFMVDGVLSLNGYSNTISSLSGASTGVVEMTSGEILTISDGGTTFFGYITAAGGITLSGGTLTLTPSGSSSNNYTGATLIESGATLRAGNTSAFSSNSSFTVDGALSLNGKSNTISSLTGTGSVYSERIATLTVTNGGTFFGTLSGSLGLEVDGGNLELSGSANDYVGTTKIQSGATLTASVNGALSSSSDFIFLTTFSNSSLLEMGSTTQTIHGLSGAGKIEIDAGGSLTFGGSSRDFFRGSFTGSGNTQGGSITKTGSRTFTFKGTANLQETTIAEGRMNIDTTSWKGPITVKDGATLGGTATIEGNVVLDSQAILSPTTFTFTKNHTVTFADKSKYNVLLNDSGSSQLLLAADTTLRGDLVITLPSRFVPTEESYTIIKMIEESIYEDTFGAITYPSGYSMSVEYTSPTIVQLFISVNSISSSLLTGNRKILANYLNNFPNTLVYLNQLTLDELKTALDHISSARCYVNAFSLQNTTYSFNYEVSSHLKNRRLKKGATLSKGAKNEQYIATGPDSTTLFENIPASLQSEEMSIEEEKKDEEIPFLFPEEDAPVLVLPKPREYQVWISGFGGFSHQNRTASNQNPFFHFNSAGSLIGFDYGGDSALVGAAGGYAKNTIQMEEGFGHASSDSFVMMAYGSYYESSFFADLSLLFGASWFKNSQNISFPGFSSVAHSSHSAWMLDPHLDFGYYFDFGWVGLEPYASLDAAIVFEEEFSEKGAYPFNFSQSSRNSELLRSEIGVASYQQKSFSDINLLFKESASYVNKTPWGNMTTALVGSFTSITLETISETQNFISPSFEFLIEWQDFTFSAMYKGEFGSNYHSNEVFGTFSYEF